jgi:hypothetical protein
MLQQDINSRSQVIRVAIENFISENIEETASKKILIRLPNNTILKLLDAISAGDVLNIPTAVQIALDRLLNSIEEEYLKTQKELQNILTHDQDLK